LLFPSLPQSRRERDPRASEGVAILSFSCRSALAKGKGELEGGEARPLGGSATPFLLKRAKERVEGGASEGPSKELKQN
jgi:hypothetical protein